MQFIKTICVLTVLGALAYGAYNTLTSSPTSEPPVEAANWDSPDDVQLPGVSSPRIGPASGATTPKYGAGATASVAPGGPGASITNVRPVGAPPVPDRYPSTNVPPGPLDAVDASPLATTVGASMSPYGATGNSGVSPASAVTAGGMSPVPQVVQAGPMTMPNALAGTPGGAASPLPTSPTGAVSFPPAAVTAAATTAPALIPSMEKVQQFLNQSRFAEAHEELSQWFDNSQFSPEEKRRVQETLDELAGRVVYSREHLLEPPHTVVQGETLQAVADRYQVPLELLVKINGIADPLYLPAGTQLKVIRGPFDALVDKSRGSLTLFVNDGLYAGSFPIAQGRDLTLPDGNYTVQAKLVNPTFQAADGMIAADDPRNPLGERWLDLGNRQGIHGCSDPTTPASGSARGYLILAPRDSEDVYDILSVGSKVMIRP